MEDRVQAPNPLDLEARGDGLMSGGDAQGALVAFTEAARLAPAVWRLYAKAGAAYMALGQVDAAIASFGRARAIMPQSPAVLANLGAALSMAKRHGEAIEVLHHAIALKPGYSLGYNNLGNALAAAGDHYNAHTAFIQALDADPASTVALIGLGRACADMQRFDEARSWFHRALALDPMSADALANLAAAEFADGDLLAAARYNEQALSAAPNSQGTAVHLAMCYAHLGRWPEFHAMTDKAIALDPNAANARSILLFGLGLDPAVERPQFLAAHRDFGNVLPAVAAPAPRGGDKIRVGYVSGDFRVHACAHFLLPLIRACTHAALDVHCYSNHTVEDGITQAFKDAASHWRDIHHLDDPATAALIAADGIDVLVDCSGHTDGNRLGVFALRPAARAVTWLGYHATTGMKSIDYRLTDDILDPPVEGNLWNTETLIRMPHGIFAYDPLSPLPNPAPSPVLKNGYVTFGSFNNLSKVNDHVLRLWARVMNAVPASKLLIKDRRFGHGAMRSWFTTRLTAAGIGEDRATLMGRISDKAGHLAVLNQVDICLDTHPYSGATTTCDALWMGVPVVTLRGDRYVARQSASILTAAGLPDLIAEDADGFVAIAARLAADRTRLSNLREDLRIRLAASPLGDARILARDMEAVFRDIVSGTIHTH